MIRHVIPFFTRAVAAIGATVVLLASVADAQPQPSPQVGDVVAGPSAAGTKFRLIIEKGSVAFTVPANWRVLGMQARPPVSAAVFQAPNPADTGTPDSTNVLVSVLHLDADKARAARMNVGKALGPTPPVTSQYHGWTVYAQQGSQSATTYTVLDSVRDVPDLDIAVAVRVAWPHLSGNARGYDADMTAVFHRLLDSVSIAPGPYAPAPGEVVRRPTG